METKIAIFKGKQIRKTVHNDEWWFSIIDIIEALTDSGRPRKYWSDLKKKLVNEGYDELSEKIGQLKLPSADGKMYSVSRTDSEIDGRLRFSPQFVEHLPIPEVNNSKKQAISKLAQKCLDASDEGYEE